MFLYIGFCTVYVEYYSYIFNNKTNNTMILIIIIIINV